MIDPTKGVPPHLVEQASEESYERFRMQLLETIETLLRDFEMTWDDLAAKTRESSYTQPGGGAFMPYASGGDLRAFIGGGNDLCISQINDVFSWFSMEPYILARPRYPWIKI